MKDSASSLSAIKLGVVSLKMAALLDVHPPLRLFNALRDRRSWPGREILKIGTLIFVFQRRGEFFIVRECDAEGAEDEGATAIDHGDEDSLREAARFFGNALELVGSNPAAVAADEPARVA
ncbi:hypothetical protein CL628_01635 [bacterium]|nr:hypothetical protein [bacterium]